MKERKKRKEFYTLQVESVPVENTSEEVNANYVPKKKSSILAENVGYRLDPKRYDSLRVKKVEEPVKETKEEPEYSPVQDNTIDDNYEDIADDYEDRSESDETSINDADPIDNDYSSDEDLYDEDNVIEDEAEEEPVEDSSIKDEAITEAPKEETIPDEEPVVDSTPQVVPVSEIKLKSKKKKKYVAPSLDLLQKSSGKNEEAIQLAEEQKASINKILAESGIKAHVHHYVLGPTVIEHLVSFDVMSEDINKIKSCERNLQMYLMTTNIRMQIPVPGLSYVGIEVPKPVEYRTTVCAGDMLSDKEFRKSKMILPVAVGRDNFNKNIFIDIADMPHGLCAGTTQSGKSVCLNLFITSLIYHFSPDKLRLVLIDPKKLEFTPYSGIPHLAIPVVTEKEYFEPTLLWLVQEMERRYSLLNTKGCKNLKEYNELMEELHQDYVPYIVTIMDEFNDWFLDATNEMETAVTRLTQKARAAGIHIIFATQHPSADVIKGAIKANVPTRLAFKVASQNNSVVILGQAGAEKLEGHGDVIVRHYGMDDTRLQAAYVSNSEIRHITDFLRENNEVDYICDIEEIKQSCDQRGPGNGSSIPDLGRNDPLFEEVSYYIVRNKNASVNQLQKIFKTGFNRMDLIFKDLTELGVVTAAVQGGRREVLVDETRLEEILENI